MLLFVAVRIFCTVDGNGANAAEIGGEGTVFVGYLIAVEYQIVEIVITRNNGPF